jgi:L-malate glycosyltransferase
VNGHPLRILVLADAGSFHTARYVRELRRQGCCVLLASLERGGPVHVRLKRIGPLASFHYALASRQVRTVIKRFSPDVINAHFATGYGWLAQRAQADNPVPVALHLWGSDILRVPHKSRLHRYKAKVALRGADLIVGDSEYLLDQARRIEPLKNPAVVYWGIERESLALGNAQRKLSRPLRIIVPRHHEPIYNNELILRALTPLIQERKVTLTAPAFGSRFMQFRKLTEGLPQGTVICYQRLPRGQFMAMMAQHDVYLSAAESDSSPASLIEAMGLGLLPVVADIPGVREWMLDDTGFLFQGQSQDQLRKIVTEIVGSGEDFMKMRAANRERVLKCAVFENCVAETIDRMCVLVKARN